MLIRFQIKNLYSFEAEIEFNLLTNHSEELSHHKKHYNGIDILRLSAGTTYLIYNGSTLFSTKYLSFF